jgi:hypothetical protein
MVSALALDDIKIEDNHPNITYFFSNGTKVEYYYKIFRSITASGASTAVLSNGTSLYPYIGNSTVPPSDSDPPTPYANISFHGVFFHKTRCDSTHCLYVKEMRSLCILWSRYQQTADCQLLPNSPATASASTELRRICGLKESI